MRTSVFRSAAGLACAAAMLSPGLVRTALGGETQQDSGQPAGAFKGTSNSVAFQPDQQRFSRDQGTIEGLARWGKELVARATPPCRFTLESRACEPIKVPQLDEVLAVAGDTVRFAAGMRQGKPALVSEQGGQWKEVALPERALDAGLRPLFLGTSGDEVALIELSGGPGERPKTALFSARHQGTWTSTELRPHLFKLIPQHIAFGWGRWLLGYDLGEWGGGLTTIDGEGAVAKLQQPGADPVTGIAAAPDGRLYVSEGLAHLGMLTGQVGFLDQDWTWKPLFNFDNFKKKHPGGSFRPDTVTGLAVDTGGRLYMLTGSQGVVRVEGDKLVSVTPGWPRGFLYGAGLLIDGDTAVAGTFDSGVVIWKLGTSQGRRIEVPRRSREDRGR